MEYRTSTNGSAEQTEKYYSLKDFFLPIGNKYCGLGREDKLMVVIQ